MFIALCLLLAASPQAAMLAGDPRLDRHVTFRVAAAPAKKTIEDFAKSASLPLAASGTIQSDVVAVDVTDVPARDLMTRLSDAVGGEWISESGTYYLARSDADLAKVRAADHARLLAALKAEFAKRTKALATQAPFDSAAARQILDKYKQLQSGGPGRPHMNIGDLAAQTPMGRFAAHLFAALDPAVLAQAPPRRRTVFSTRPTRMEAPLAVELGSAVDEFASEQRVYASEVQSLDRGERISLMESPFGFYASSTAKPPARLNVELNRVETTPDTVALGIRLYDAGGEIVASSQFDVNVAEFPSDAELRADPNDPKLEVSPDDVTTMQVLGATFGDKPAKVTKLPAELRARFMRPDVNEVLGMFPSSLLLAATEARGLDLVADLPDAYVILGATPGFTGAPTAASILKLVTSLAPSLAPVHTDGKWLVVCGGQTDPDAVMCHRTDRTALAQLFANGSDGVLPIEALATYAYRSGGVVDDWMYMLLSGLLFPASQINDIQHWDALKLIGALMQQQGGRRLAPGRTAFANLNSDCVDQLQTIVFFRQAEGVFNSNPRSARELNQGDDPCEVLPNGLPNDGFIEVEVKDADAVYANGSRAEQVEPQQLAFYQEIADHPERYQGERAPYTTADRFRVGTRHEVNLVLHFTPDLSKTLTATESHIREGVVSFGQLPQSFQDAYKQARSNIQG